MKKLSINLHIDYKKVLCVMLLFSLISIVINGILGLAINENLVELKALLKSDYTYSVITHKSLGVDDYYQFNASISFSTLPEDATSLNAEVLMQSESSNYTDSVYWNGESLSETGVAVSRGLAQRYGLHLGDSLFSKHNVDSEIHEYSIEEILPDVTHSRITKQNSFNSGIIIMGYDKKYVDNITHTWVAFTSKTIEGISDDDAVEPEGIIYRDDEISSTAIALLPYFVIFTLVCVLGVSLILLVLSKDCSYNFRRLIALGFEKRKLNRAYYKLTRGLGIANIMIATLISAGIFTLLGICSLGFIILCWDVLVEIIVLLLLSTGLKRRLWR